MSFFDLFDNLLSPKKNTPVIPKNKGVIFINTIWKIYHDVGFRNATTINLPAINEKFISEYLIQTKDFHDIDTDQIELRDFYRNWYVYGNSVGITPENRDFVMQNFLEKSDFIINVYGYISDVKFGEIVLHHSIEVTKYNTSAVTYTTLIINVLYDNEFNSQAAQLKVGTQYNCKIRLDKNSKVQTTEDFYGKLQELNNITGRLVK